MPFINGAVAHISRYKQGFFFSPQFMGANSWNGYENKLLFESLGDGLFADVARPMGCDSLDDGRGCVVADLNNDGRLDLIISNNNSRPTIYLNNQPQVGNWLRVDMHGAVRGSSRDPLGTRVDVLVKYNGESRTITRWVEAGAGYASQSEYTLHFGLGMARSVEFLTVTWPGRSPRRFTKDELGSVTNGTVSVGGPDIMLRKKHVEAITSTQARAREISR
jgi:hypothetical protein